MPRLSLGFDMEQFVDHCRMTKPPYECPHASCGRVYRSFNGIQNHMNSFDHENPPPNIGTPKFGNYEQEPLPIPMSTDLKMVEFELDGKFACISVYDPIEIVSKEFYEASLPPALEEPVQEIVKTPTIKSQGKHLTPKASKNRPKDKDKGVDVQRYTIEEKKSQKLPEAAFKIIPNYYSNLPDAPIKTDSYYKFIEKSIEELDLEVEYDMDEEDIAWLGMINKKRASEKLNTISMEDFELLMDRLEKESFFQAQSTGREPGAPIDEDAVCCICMDGECQNSNVILFCDMCNLAVHQECYGVPYIPEGQWLCRRCLQSPSRAVDCALCPNKGGAFKQTDDGRWAHVVCAMWIPEVCFANTVFLEPIDSIGNIPPARWKLTCYICVQRAVGACIQCNKVNCYTAFHVTCAQQAGLHMKIDAIRETSANGTSVTVRKAAYCDMHTPADSDARPQVEEMMDAAKKAAAKAASRQKMKKARKILAEKRLAAPVVSVPTLPADRIQELANLVQIDKRAMFIHRLLAFWTLKRQSRNGVPLLRRLTTSYPRRNANYSNNNNNIIHSPSPCKKSPELLKKRSFNNPPSIGAFRDRIPVRKGEKVIYNDMKSNDNKFSHEEEISLQREINHTVDDVSERKFIQRIKEGQADGILQQNLHRGKGSHEDTVMSKGGLEKGKIEGGEKFSEEIQYWQRLRQDLERARLLCELIRKREKMKRDLVKAQAEERLVQLAPFVHLLLQKIDQLQEKDVQQIFAEPVDFEEVPDYLDVVKHPMDLSTMRQKAQAHQYQNVDQFTADFELMIENCLTYNSRDTIFFRAGVKLRDQGGAVIRQLVRDVETTGFDLETGLMLSHRPKPPPNHSEVDILKEIDNILGSELNKDETYEMRKVKLLYLLDQAHLIKSYISRIKNIKLLRREIGVVRRKLTFSESGMSGSFSKTSLFHSDNSDKEDSDKDDSSVIDDEAEPGVPSRPSSPQSSLVPIAAAVLQAPPAVLPEASLPEVETEEVTHVLQKRSVLSDEATPVVPVPVNKIHRKSSQKVDLKQRKIDAFFTKLTKPDKLVLEEMKENEPVIMVEDSKQIGKKGATEIVSTPLPAPRKRGRPPKHSLSAIGMSGSGEIKQPYAYKAATIDESSHNGKIPVEFTEDMQAETVVEDNNISTSLPSVSSKKSSFFSKRPSHFLKKPIIGDSPSGKSDSHESTSISLLHLPQVSTLTNESFKVYRQGGEISQETDDETQSESNSSLTDSDDESQSDSGSDEEGSETDSSTGADDHSNGGLSGTSGEQIPLEPLDLVWAKCRGYPWYPALIINPKMPRTGYFHNHVPIPVPPDEVLAHASNYHIPMYLVLFFDQKRTWQWLPRNKLEPLGVNSALDKAKLVESRKPADRKAVKKAYEKAILHRCRVTGENTGLSGESDNDSQP